MALTKEDLQAIGNMLDERLSAQEKRFDKKLSIQKQDIMHDMNLLIENVVTPRFNLLAEGQQSILEKLVPRSRVDELEDEVKFLKAIVRQITDDVQQLKKAQ